MATFKNRKNLKKPSKITHSNNGELCSKCLQKVPLKEFNYIKLINGKIYYDICNECLNKIENQKFSFKDKDI